MPKNNKQKPKKNTARKQKTSKYLILLAVFVILSLCLSAYLGVRLVLHSFKEEANATAGEFATPAPSSEVLGNYPELDLSDNFIVSFYSPTVIGTQRAVICAEMVSEKNGFERYGFLVRDPGDYTGFEIPAACSGTLLYARTDQLEANQDYLIIAYAVDAGEKLYAKETMALTTPEPILTPDQVNKILSSTFPEGSDNLSEEKELGFETDACLQLLGFDIGEFGKYDFETKSAILMLEYSFASAEYACDWRVLTGLLTDNLLKTMKDILSVTPVTNKKSVLKPFAISSYSLAEYAEFGEDGAVINSERLVLDALKQDTAATELFSVYPFVVDSAEFQEKYAALINDELTSDSSELSTLATLYGWDTLREPQEIVLQAIAAKNKAFFSAEQSDWLLSLAENFEEPFTLKGQLSNQTDFTLIMPAAVAFCYLNDDYKTRFGTDLPTTLSLHTSPESWTAYSNGYGKAEVLKFSALWHLSQQASTPVPGFNLSEYAVSVDFIPADDTILTSDVYQYLYTYGNQFGFFPDPNRPYRWFYLGKAAPEENLVLAPPANALEN